MAAVRCGSAYECTRAAFRSRSGRAGRSWRRSPGSSVPAGTERTQRCPPAPRGGQAATLVKGKSKTKKKNSQQVDKMSEQIVLKGRQEKERGQHLHSKLQKVQLHHRKLLGGDRKQRKSGERIPGITVNCSCSRSLAMERWERRKHLIRPVRRLLSSNIHIVHLFIILQISKHLSINVLIQLFFQNAQGFMWPQLEAQY